MNQTVAAANGVGIPQLGFGLYKIKDGGPSRGQSRRLFEWVIAISIRPKFTVMKRR